MSGLDNKVHQCGWTLFLIFLFFHSFPSPCCWILRIFSWNCRSWYSKHKSPANRFVFTKQSDIVSGLPGAHGLQLESQHWCAATRRRTRQNISWCICWPASPMEVLRREQSSLLSNKQRCWIWNRRSKEKFLLVASESGACLSILFKMVPGPAAL